MERDQENSDGVVLGVSAPATPDSAVTPRVAGPPVVDSDDDADDLDPGPDVCWCGVERPYYAPLPTCCGGSGMIDCHCGGDQCVCHWHGETGCMGCEDCEQYDDYDII